MKVDWLKKSDPWINENKAKYPVLGEENSYVYADYSKAKDDSIKAILTSHSEDSDLDINIIYCTLNRFCGDCESCKKEESRQSCDCHPQYYFSEFLCAKTGNKFYLVTEVEPEYESEDNWFFIPGNRFNIQIFNHKYLNGKYKFDL